MSGSESGAAKCRLRLPATSANLGPGFDAAAVALDRYLEIEAEPAQEFSIRCAGRDAKRCSRIKGNLVLDVYKEVLRKNDRQVLPLTIVMDNGIPLGMGLGSSAAGRLAAIALANHFGELGWDGPRILVEAGDLEGHPDNAAACWLGGFVMAACEEGAIHVARVEPPAAWRAVVAIPQEPLATSKARAALPDSYSRSDTVANIQSAGLLGLAFAQGRGDLLRIAMADRVHQPYRAPICPLLGPLLPLAGHNGILGVALSGAGPAVLLICENESSLPDVMAGIRAAVAGSEPVELLQCKFQVSGAEQDF